jgi:iron complex outermembrane receptor protein
MYNPSSRRLPFTPRPFAMGDVDSLNGMQGRRRAAASRLAGCVLVLCPFAAAQTQDRDLKGLSLEQLGNIEVTTVSKEPVTIARTPAAIYVITQEDIRRSGVTSIPEALRLAPGVDVERIDSVKWAIGIRGFTSRLSRSVLVLIDGRSVYSPLFHGVYWEVQDTLLEDIDRIEVIRGPGGSIWGANAVDGVINIITKKAKDTRGGLVSAGGGNVDQASLDARYGGGDKNLSYRVYGKGFDRGPEYHSDNRNFDDWRRFQTGFRADWDATVRDSLTLQGDFYDGVAGESTRIVSLSPPSANVVNSNAFLAGGNILGRWQRTFSGTSDLQIQTYFDRVNRRQASQAEYRNTFDLDLVHRFALASAHEFTWGFGVRLSQGWVPAVVPTYVFSPDKRTDHLYTGFLQDEVALVPERLSFTAGVKIIHSAFTGFDAEPSGRLLWTPTARQSFWGAVTRAVRTPSDVEDYLTSTTAAPGSPLSFNRTTGNGTFTSETLIGYEAGYRQLVHAKFSVDLAAYYNQYHHLLSLEPDSPFTETSDGYTYIVHPFVNGNGLTGDTKGFELIANWKPYSWWRIQPSYAFLDMNLSRAPYSRDANTVSNTEGSSPQHQIGIQSYLDLGKKVEFSQAFRYISALPAQQVSSYATMDARLSWRLSPAVDVAITGQNLFQPRHFEFGGDPGPLVGIRRSVFASVTWRK